MNGNNQDDILGKYREGIRAFLKAPNSDSVSTSVLEFQTIIIEEVLDSAQVEICGLYNCKKGDLWSSHASEIVKEKKLSNVDVKIICSPMEDCGVNIGAKRECMLIAPSEFSFLQESVTMIVVDKKTTIIVGVANDDPLILFFDDLNGIRKSGLSFINELWDSLKGKRAAISAEGSHS